MRTLFWLFGDYGDARSAVEALLELGVDVEQVNAIIAEEAAKEAMDVNWGRAAVQVSDEEAVQGQTQGERLQGLDGLLARQQGVRLEDVGRVLAGGELVTLAVNAAASPASQGGGLEAALLDLGVGEEVARKSVAAIRDGGALVAARLPDERASEANWAVQNLQGSVRASATVG